jgi:quercetin dioxygenase-like cupin family protein
MVSTTKVLLRSEQTGDHLSVVENTLPAGLEGPPLHTHDFDETFYVLDGELTVQLEDEFTAVRHGDLVFAPRGAPHTLANLSEATVRYLIIFTPAGFERSLARRTAERAGSAAPAWALAPAPEVIIVGPPISRESLPPSHSEA